MSKELCLWVKISLRQIYNSTLCFTIYPFIKKSGFISDSLFLLDLGYPNLTINVTIQPTAISYQPLIDMSMPVALQLTAYS